jgi:hypothetical protein
MKRILILVVCIALFCACESNKTKKNYRDIQGDWFSEVIKSNWKDFRLMFSFEDTLCTYLDPWGEYTNYRIKDSLLFIKETNFRREIDTISNQQTYVFKIVTFGNEKLRLIPYSKETEVLLDQYNDFKKDTVTFYKVKTKNNIVPSKISFFSSVCYGICPSIIIEIDSSKRILYYGYAFTEKKGGYKGIISSRQYSIILNKIRNLELDSIKEDYSASWTDDQTCGIVIDYENKSLYSRVYGFDKEPIELRILFHKLMEVYKSIDLERDSINVSDFKHGDMFYRIFPPPPPPYKQGARFIPPNVIDTIR